MTGKKAGHLLRDSVPPSTPRCSSGLGTRGMPLSGVLAAAGSAREPGIVVGLDVGGTKTHAVAADLNGYVLAETVEPTRGEDPEELVGQLSNLTTHLAGSAHARLQAVAVGCPGIVDPRTGVVGLSPNAPAVEGLHLQELLERSVGVPVDLDNDVNLAAAAECWLGAARGCHDFIFINLGTGIGAGLVLDGDLYHGPHGGAGEIAHLPFGSNGLAPPTQLGAYERAVWPSALQQRWAGDSRSAPPPSQILECAEHGDQAAADALTEEVRLLAAGVQVLVAVVDPDLVVFGGGLGRNHILLHRLTATLSEAALPVALSATGLGERGGAIGAVLLALGTAATTSA